MIFLKEKLTRNEKVVKRVSLLLFISSITAMSIGFIEERSCSIAQANLEQSYDEYSKMIINDLCDIKESSYNVMKLAYNHDEQCYSESKKLFTKCGNFISSYKDYLSREPNVNKVHESLIECISEIYKGSESLNDILENIITNGVVTTQDLDNQSCSMEQISLGCNSLSGIISKIQCRFY